MMYKYFTLFIAVAFSMISANAADKIHVFANSEFNTASPSKSIDVTVVESSLLGLNLLRADDILHCNIIKVITPKRGKRTASFAVCPVSYTSGGNTKIIKGKFYGKYASKILSKEEIKNIDAKKVGKKAALTVGNHFVMGVAPAFSMAEGMIKNEEGNRLESGIKQVYKDSPLSYVEKGEELVLEQGDSFYLIFKPSNSKYAKKSEGDVNSGNSTE